MSGIILIGYNKYLNGKIVDADSLIKDENKKSEVFIQNVKLLPQINFEDSEIFYSKEYKRFLRTKKINEIVVYER